MPKGKWTRKSKFTPEQREKAARESMKEPDGAVSERYGVPKQTLANWRRRLGLKKPLTARGSTGKTGKAAKKRAAKKKAARPPSNGASHTLVSSRRSPGVTISGTGFEALEAQLRQSRDSCDQALESLAAMRVAFSSVFGG